nr:transcriptional regulator [Lysinibacillus timonensis]
MSQYKEGYDYYVFKCEEFGIEPINFYFYITQLSKEQLDLYNQQAFELKAKLVS